MAFIDRDTFFQNKDAGAKWDVAVAINRNNPVPLDNSAVFKTKAEAEAYVAENPIAYPGQLLTVVGTDSTQVYKVNPDGTLTELIGSGSSDVAVDGKTITKTAAGELQVAVSAEAGNGLSAKEDGLFAVGAEYLIQKKETAEDGYFATYQLTKDGTVVGDLINIPKDYLVKSCSVKTSAGEEDPSGLPAGEKYIDFVINTKDGSGEESHLYLAVADLVTAYTAGNGIAISDDNKISVKVHAGYGVDFTTDGELELSQELREIIADYDNFKNQATSDFGSTAELVAAVATNQVEIDKVDGKIAAAKEAAITEAGTNADAKITAKVGDIGDKTVADFVTTTVTEAVEQSQTELAAIAKTGNLNDLIQSEGDVLILDCGGAN